MSTTSPSTMTTFPEIPDSSSPEILSVYNPSDFNIPVKKTVLEKLLRSIEIEKEIVFKSVELVYVDEEEIIEINKEYLNRDYVTDIISFSYNEPGKSSKSEIEGTLYCCAPRIAEQSEEMKSDMEAEFYRIFIHGLLHLAGYNDSTKTEKETMTKLENHFLEMLSG